MEFLLYFGYKSVITNPMFVANTHALVFWIQNTVQTICSLCSPYVALLRHGAQFEHPGASLSTGIVF